MLRLAHHLKLADHPGLTLMFLHLRRTNYWPLMAAYIVSIIQSCPHCAHNRLHLIRRKQPTCLFPAKKPLECVADNAGSEQLHPCDGQSLH